MGNASGPAQYHPPPAAGRRDQVRPARPTHDRDSDGPWQVAIRDWATAMRAAGRPATTIRTRTQHLHQLHRETRAETPWTLTTVDLTTWLADHDWKPETLYSARCSLVGFYRWAVEGGRLAQDPSERLPKVRRGRGTPHPLPDDLMAHLLDVAGPREMLMVLLAGRCGLRRVEVAVVHTRDVLLDRGGWALTVHGKGARERTVPLPDAIAKAILRKPDGYAFPGKVDGHLAPASVGHLISGLLPSGWSTHALRHRFATRAYAVEKDILVVQRLLGHTTPTTTMVYVDVPDDDLRRTVLAAA